MMITWVSMIYYLIDITQITMVLSLWHHLYLYCEKLVGKIVFWKVILTFGNVPDKNGSNKFEIYIIRK